MARSASQAIAGYYPTPPHLTPLIASTLNLGPRSLRSHLLFDPCAGDGQALVDLAAAAGNYDPPHAARYCVGIELEAGRAAKLRRRLGEYQAHHGDALTYAIHGAASILFLNPPYDVDRELGRLEHRFLRRFTDTLAPTGALLFVVPHYALVSSADFLAQHYHAVHILRFPDADFAAYRQVLLVATKNECPGAVDVATRDRILAAAHDAGDLPVLDGPLPQPLASPGAGLASQLRFESLLIDLGRLLEGARPFEAQPQPFGFDQHAEQLLGAPMPVALPPRPAHIALALSAGMMNGRRLEPNDPARLPALLAKGTLSRDFVTVEAKHNREGEQTGEVRAQQPRLDIHVLRLDTLSFHKLALGTEPTDTTDLSAFNTADLLAQYGDSLAAIVREQLPALHDPSDPSHQLELTNGARAPFRRQRACIEAALKLLALGENPQALAEVGTGKSTIALEIVRHLQPARIAATRAALERTGFDAARLRPVRRVLIVCPPHLLQSWTDQAAACLPGARVQIVQALADLDVDADLYVLSREAAKLGPEIVGLRGGRCPRCAGLLEPASPQERAQERHRCTVDHRVPGNAFARIAEQLVLRTYRYLDTTASSRWSTVVAHHPAVYRRISDLPPALPTPVLDLSDLEEALLSVFEAAFASTSPYDAVFHAPLAAAAHLARLRGARPDYVARFSPAITSRFTNYSTHAFLVDRLKTEAGRALPLDAEARAEALREALSTLLIHATFDVRTACGEPLFAMRPNPRRVPIARYILQRKSHWFDFLILDEAHDFTTTGSAQQKAAHRLVELRGVPTLALTGSLMNGYASSLFSHTWALSQRFRRVFDRDDKAAFVARYGYRKMFFTNAALEREQRSRTFGARSDREDDAAAGEIKNLGEAPGVLPNFLLEHVLPTTLIMHKADLETELPPKLEEPVAIEPEPDDLLARKLLSSYQLLLSQTLKAIHADRSSELAGKLFGAFGELPTYLDLAGEDCGPFEICYPESAGGALVAAGESMPSRWRSPKERWLLAKLRAELAEGRWTILFLHNTGNAPFVRRILRLLTEEFATPIVFLDPARVPTAKRQTWLDENVIRPGRRILVTHPSTIETGLNNLVSFSTAIWYQGTDRRARTIRQANGRLHRIGQTRPVRIFYPYYARTLQKAALDLDARKISASLQVDGLDLTAALEAAGATSETDREHATAAMSFGRALYDAALRERR